jgi:hypothetical protein
LDANYERSKEVREMGVTLSLVASQLNIRLKGASRFLSFKGRLAVPFAHIVAAHVMPGKVAAKSRGWFRFPGTSFPGITSGSYRGKGEWQFWDVRRATEVLAIDLRDERYSRLVLQVPDPATEAQKINSALEQETRTDGSTA